MNSCNTESVPLDMSEVKTIRVSIDDIPPYIEMTINTKRIADRIKMRELNNPPVINTESKYGFK